jgi:hypothetical protein
LAVGFFTVHVGCTVLLIAVAFCYFMVREPSILRSEDYSLAKHAMDKGLFTPEIAHQILSREKELREGGADLTPFSVQFGVWNHNLVFARFAKPQVYSCSRQARR